MPRNGATIYRSERKDSMMFRRVFALLVLALGLITAASAAGASGKWTATFDTQVGEQKYTWDLTAVGSKLTGKYTSSNGEGEIRDGKIEGDNLSWVETLKFQDMELRIEYSAKLSGDELRISRKVADIATEEGVAKRVN
jgi:hypothetical protein